jgi:hypothetical protein
MEGWVRHVACMREMIDVYKILVGKSEGKRPLRQPRHRWEDYIKMDIREIGWEGVYWMHLAHDRYHWWAFVSMVMSL